MLSHNLTEANAKGRGVRDYGSQLGLDFRNREVENIALESKIPRHVLQQIFTKVLSKETTLKGRARVGAGASQLGHT